MASSSAPVALKLKPRGLQIMEAAVIGDPDYRPGPYGHPNASALMGARSQTSKVLNGSQLPGLKSALRTAWMHAERTGTDVRDALWELYDPVDANGNLVKVATAPPGPRLEVAA